MIAAYVLDPGERAYGLKNLSDVRLNRRMQPIKELIGAEEVSAVLSDDRIVELLRQEKISIARRTVAKYREAMQIPSSVDRRRLKKSTVWNSR